MNRLSASVEPRVGIASLASGVPKHEFSQADARAFAERFFSQDFPDRSEFSQLLQSFENSQVATRQLAVPVAWFERPWTFAEKNAFYMEAATELSRRVAEQAIVDSGYDPAELGAVVFASSTGIATPSLDARLVEQLGLSRSISRVPLWGLGCAGGGAALGRALVLSRGLRKPVLAVACELCSLTFVHEDRRKSNVIAAALFGDGAAAAVVAPEPWWSESQGPQLISCHAELLQGTEHVMGWDVVAGGLQVRFAPSIPNVVRQSTAGIVRSARRLGGLGPAETFAHFVVHPGGPKVLEAYEEALKLPRETFRHAHDVLSEHGNMSGPTVLFVLERFLAHTRPTGQMGLLLGLGPGLCAETTVFRW